MTKFTPGMPQPGVPDPPATENTPESISAAAHAYQLAIQQQQVAPTPAPAPTPTPTPTAVASPAQVAAVDIPSRDVLMSDAALDGAVSPAVLPPRMGTPSRNLNGNDTSRAASAHPEPPTMPKEAPPHGAPTRQYINGKVTGPLLDGMKILAKEQPKDPLRVLGEYLLQRSRELEGT